MTLNAARFQKSLTYKNEADTQSVMADLEQVRAIDEATEKLLRKWRIITALSFLGGFGVAVLLAINNQKTIAGGVALAGGCTFVFGIITYMRHRSSDIDNRRYLLASQLLGLLRVDFAPEQPVSAELDFRRIDHKAKFKDKGTAGPWKVKFYRDPWLSLSGRFADGTSFQLVQTDLHQDRSQVKRSSSGKYKHKSKTKSAFEAELRLRFKPEKYRHMANLKTDAEQAVQLPDGIELKKLRYNDKEIGLRIAGKGPWSVMQQKAMLGEGFDGTRTLSLMFLSLFQILNLSKAIDKSAASGETA